LSQTQFDSDWKATLHTLFAKRQLEVCYLNPKKLGFGAYQIETAFLNGQKLSFTRADGGVKIERKIIEALSKDVDHRLKVVLDVKK
jgi:hypothetical protein